MKKELDEKLVYWIKNTRKSKYKKIKKETLENLLKENLTLKQIGHRLRVSSNVVYRSLWFNGLGEVKRNRWK